MPDKKSNNTNLSSNDDVTLATRRENAAFGGTFDTDSKANQYNSQRNKNRALLAVLLLVVVLLYTIAVMRIGMLLPPK